MRVDLVNQIFDTELRDRFEIIGPNGTGLRYGYATGTITTGSGASQSATGVLPAGATILGVVARVTTAITTTGTATNCELGTSSDNDAFGSKAFSSGTLAVDSALGGANHVGTTFTTTVSTIQGTALDLRIGVTGGGTFTAGAIKYTIFYVLPLVYSS